MTRNHEVSLKLLADECFNENILRSLSRTGEVDFVRVQSVGLSASPDPEILQWAADHGRTIISHDVNTMTRHALQRLLANAPMTGVIIVPSALPLRAAIDDLLLIVKCAEPTEIEGQIWYVPLR